jgi:hypothetical protein
MSMYVFLPSTASARYHPDNERGDFTVELARPIRLDSKWECAVTELIYDGRPYDNGIITIQSSLCDESHVDGGMDLVLRRIPSQNKPRVFAKFVVPYYIPVGPHTLTNIRVYIKGEDGIPSSVAGQPTWCTLHLRKAVC